MSATRPRDDRITAVGPHKCLPGLHDFLANLVAAAADARAYPGDHVVGSRAIGERHRVYGRPDHTEGRAAPPGMNCTDGPADRVGQQHRHAVGVQRHHRDPWLIRHQRVGFAERVAAERTAATDLAAGHGQNGGAMHLTGDRERPWIDSGDGAPALPLRPGRHAVAWCGIADVGLRRTPARESPREAVAHARDRRDSYTDCQRCAVWSKHRVVSSHRRHGEVSRAASRMIRSVISSTGAWSSVKTRAPVGPGRGAPVASAMSPT